MACGDELAVAMNVSPLYWRSLSVETLWEGVGAPGEVSMTTRLVRSAMR